MGSAAAKMKAARAAENPADRVERVDWEQVSAALDAQGWAVLPKLLRTNRTHSANLGIPGQMVPCAILYPANPVRDDQGNAKPFDRVEHEAFQSLFVRHGEPDVVEVKRGVTQAVRRGERPEAGMLASRRHRLAARIALRQMLYTDGQSATLDTWRHAFEVALR